MIQAISDNIKTALETLKGTNKPLVNVYDFHTLENTGYPFVSFEAVELQGQIRDTCNNERNVIFDLYIFQEIGTNGRRQATQIVYRAMDDILSVFDKDYTLSDTVELVTPIGGSIVPFNIGNGSAIVGTIQLNCRYNAFI